ncbi:MAG: PEP-CTERM sorting domain-containing protein [Candidatus Pacebacteria bacterium]|nr:PEP-CTERM sorting domain-containing protein [Candidatus Paceibacterota bacterium]
MMKRMLRVAVVAAALAAPAGSAGPIAVVVPNENATVEATNNTGMLIDDTGYTYQEQIAGSQLSAITVGNTITALRYRLNGGSSIAGPTSQINFDNYDITLAQATNTIGSWSTTFADNMTDPVQVRSGTLSIAAGTFGTGIPAPWGPWIQFDVPYVYQGGDLVLLVSHDGHGGSDNSFLDANGSGTEFAGQYRIGYNETTSSSGVGVTVIQFAAEIVPEPTTLALLGLAAACVANRRRRS